MKTFKASNWDSDADEHHSYQEMFKESSNKKKGDRAKLSAAKDEKNEKKLKKLLKKQLRDFKSNDVNVITVQTKIELGKAQKMRDDLSKGSFEASKKERKLRKKCKKSKTEAASDSDDSEGEVSKKQKKMLKRYSTELNSLNNDSDKLSHELLKEKKRQRKLKRKLEKAARKQMLLNKAIESKIKDRFENLKKIKKEPIDNPGISSTSKDKPKKREKPKVIERNIPESLNIARKIKLQQKLKTILTQAKKEEQHRPVMTLRQKMMEKLKAARFRFLNEQIYTTDSKEAQRIFRSDPEAFIAYHEGYRQQVKSWPVNPLHVIIRAIKKMPKTYVIADFGCGEAKLAKLVEQRVHSFDLVAVSDDVIACDMANVPLKDASVDVVVFCLSLMGTNLHDYILEANRVLKLGGVLKIAEVESRFGDVDNFIEGVQRFSFNNTWKDLSQNLFYFMDFRKVNNIKNKKKLPTISLLPCLYKKR